jgi:hypothetical protein
VLQLVNTVGSGSAIPSFITGFVHGSDEIENCIVGDVGMDWFKRIFVMWSYITAFIELILVFLTIVLRMHHEVTK